MPGGWWPVAGWWAARAASACWRWALARASLRVREGLIELAAQPVPLGPQLGGREPVEIGTIRGVDG
jgi:hypothetical protein